MKKIIFVACLLISVFTAMSQTTYYWVGGPTGTSGSGWNTGSNWNTRLDGSGTTRTTPTVATTDILIVDGNNIGGATPTTGTITIKVSGSSAILNINQLKLINNANLTLQRVTAGTSTLTVNGDNGDDFVVDATSSLTMIGTAPSPDSSSVRIILGAASTGRVSGSVTLSNWGSRIITSNPVAGGALIFESGSIANVNTYEAGSYPFGSGSSGTIANSVIFNAGSKLYYKGGNSIFSNTSTYSPLVFNSGSELIIDAVVPNSYCTASNLFTGRRLANLTISTGQTVDVDNFSNVDNLTVQTGATLKLKTSGAFSISGNIINNGLLKVNTLLPGLSGTSNLLFKGNTIQTIGGSGVYDTLGVITVSADAHVVLNADLKLYGLNSSGTSANTASVVGTLNLNNHVITGTAKFQTREAASSTTSVVTGIAGTNTLTLDPTAYSTANVALGILVSGTGIASNTYITGTNSGTSTITLSNTLTANATTVTLSNNAPTLKTAHPGGIDGALTLSGGLALGTGTHYEFNGPTNTPFSLSTNNITGNVTCNSPLTTNKSQSIGGVLTLNSGNFTIRTLDTIRLRNAYNIEGGPFSNNKHIVNEVNAGNIGVLRMDSITSNILLPIGSSTHYLPVSLSYGNTTNVFVSVFEGITQDGTITGSQFTSNELENVVNAVWNITPTSSLAIANNLQLGWDQVLEGTSFTSLPNSQIGIIKNDGSAWGQTLSTGDNILNTASLSNAGLGVYSIGSQQQTQINNFVFNPISNKTYGDADFSNIATSQNLTQPISYSSSNTSVATVSPAGIIHIVGAGTTNITASQLGDGVYTDTSITRSFTVDKASLTIAANDVTRNEGISNPVLTATYSGFVNGEDSSVFLTQAVVTTTATQSSPVGTYPITVSSATAANYNITFVNGTLTVQAVLGAFTFNAIPNKTYGDADFSNVAVSQNIAQPIIYSSSNTSVATISASGVIHIVAAGTTDIAASQATDGTYPAASVTRTFVVNKANLTITANNITRNEGVANPALTVIYSGFVNGEDSSVLSALPSVTTTATQSSLAGTYPITVSGATAANYNITFVAGTLTVIAIPTTGLITYFWVGGTGSVQAPSSFSTGSKWNTRLDGTGVARPTGDTTGILIFDGSNIGGATPATGDVFVYSGSTRMSQLILRNGARVTLSRITTGNGTISIKGDSTVVEDILINSGCSFTMNAADSVSATSGNKLLITPNATGIIYGSFTLNGGTCRVEQTNPVAGGAIIFENGSICNVNTQVTYYPFGSSNGVNNGVVFRNGSKLVYKGGKSFYRASSSSIIPIVLEKGNICRFEASVPNIYSDSSLFFSNRTYSNVEIAANVSVNADDFYNIDNLTIETGATFNLKGSGTSPVSGSILNNGTFGAVSGFTSSVLLMKGNTLQTIGGTGVFNPLGALVVAAGSDVELNSNLAVNGTATSIIHGKLNLKNSTITGTGTLQTKAAGTITSAVTTATIGTRVLTLPSITGIFNGMIVTGNGIPAGSYVIGSSSLASTITISESVQSSVSSVDINGSIPVIETSNTNGVDGSIGGVGSLSLTSSTDYIFDGATTQPFSLISPASARNITINAAVTSNKSQIIDSTLTLASGIFSIRATDTIRIKNGNDIGGAPFSATKYIITQNDGFNIGVLRVDFSVGNKFYPVGTSAHYLPAKINTTSGSTINASVFEGVTNNGELTGTALNNNQLQSLVNAVWKLNRTSGSGNADVELSWDATLEGALFTAASSPLIGVIQNSNNVWSTPFGTGDNNLNTVVGNVTDFGSFSIGANANNIPFVFNPIPTKTYGDSDFNTSLYSANTTQPIIYTSSNTSVATISATGLIQIVGAGSTDINASQATDGVNPAANISRTFVVNKAALTITADNKSKVQGAVNPVLTVTYSGFVNGENESVLLTPVDIVTAATQTSPVGNYAITVSGATAANYTLSFIAGNLNVYDQLNFASLPVKTYGDPDFNTTVTSLNIAQPILYSSSDTMVAKISSAGRIRIVGAGTCTINVSQASDGTYPAASVNRDLIVNKKSLLVKLVDTSRLQGDENPSFRFIYTGFVLGENESVFTVLPFGNTIANRSSIPGVYTVTPEGAQAANYSFVYTSGLLKVFPKDATQQDIQLFSNNGNLIVNIFSPYVDLADLLLYDINGKFIKRKNILVSSGLTTNRLDVSNLASGTYVVIYRGKQRKIAQQVMIIK